MNVKKESYLRLCILNVIKVFVFSLILRGHDILLNTELIIALILYCLGLCLLGTVEIKILKSILFSKKSFFFEGKSSREEERKK